jgi:protocatechuate 3,4-dioxygenase beta subunit
MRRLLVAALLLVVGASACQDGATAPRPSSPPSSSPPSSSAPAVAAGCPVAALGEVEAGSVLVPTPSNGLPTSPARGEKLVIVGVVLDPTCRPAVGASMNIHHTDARGLYGPEGADPECCYYQGVVVADRNGRVRLETIRPAQYPVPGAPPAHIHLELRHSSGRLNTEIIFTPDPAPVTTARPDHTLPVYLSRRDGGFYGEATFVLTKS